MRMVVVDDERPARSELMYLIKQLDSSVELTEADSSERLLALLEENEFDVCFVDINLNGMNGTTLASMIKKRYPETQIVFATAYQRYAVKAFELGAVDYLLKPFDLKRVEQTLKRVKQKVPVRPAEMTSFAGDLDLNKIMIQGGKNVQILDIRDIVFIETEQRACKLYTVKGISIQNKSLNYYEKRFQSKSFFRIHKSYLVNLEYVQELIPTFNNGYSVVLKHYEKKPLPVGRSQIKELRRLFE